MSITATSNGSTTKATSIRRALKKTTKAGRAMRLGAGWRLLSGKDKLFAATLVAIINRGGLRLAIFSVPKRGAKA